MEDKEMMGVAMSDEGVQVLGCDEETEFLTMLCEMEVVLVTLAESLMVVRDKLHRNKMGWKAEMRRFRKLSCLAEKMGKELRKVSVEEGKAVKLKDAKPKSAK